MKTIKFLLLTLVGIILLLLIAALFVRKDYTVEREITINKSKNEVFQYVRLLKNQESYSAWSLMDPKMKKDYMGTDGTEGFISAWDSENKNVGKGEQEILKISDGQRIDYELRFIKPYESTEHAYMVTEEISPDKTKVRWGFSGKMNYPMNFMLLFLNMDKMVGKDFETGLDNLKRILEKSDKS